MSRHLSGDRSSKRSEREPVVAKSGTGRGQDEDGEWQEVTRRKMETPSVGEGEVANSMGQKAKPNSNTKEAFLRGHCHASCG